MPAENIAPQNIGYVSADYVLPKDCLKADKPYHKIYGILLDVRTLMYHHISHDKQMIATLAKVIENT